MEWKRVTKIVLRSFGYVFLLFILILMFDACLCIQVSPRASFLFDPLINICFCPRYSEVMEIPVDGNGTVVPCKLYRRDGAPFLLVGPYPFQEETPLWNAQSDFFFVGRDRVMGRMLDEKTDDWTLKHKWVWIGMDLDPQGRDSMAPSFFFDVKRAEDPATGLVHITCSAA